MLEAEDAAEESDDEMDEAEAEATLAALAAEDLNVSDCTRLYDNVRERDRSDRSSRSRTVGGRASVGAGRAHSDGKSGRDGSLGLLELLFGSQFGRGQEL